MRLSFYEVQTKHGLILYPRSIKWTDVYRDEFIPFARQGGIEWKDTAPERTISEEVEHGEGSIATWYRGRKRALEDLALFYLEPGKHFRFKSRQKHSAYKECHECQSLRLTIARSIAQADPPSVIHSKQLDYQRHLQWMYRQRDALERITQLATNEKFIVEVSDKMGDGCIYIPTNGHRVDSRNTSLWQFRVTYPLALPSLLLLSIST